MLAIKYFNLSCCLRSLLFQDNISDSTLKKLKKYIDNPKFTPENVEKVSKVCYLTECLRLHVRVCLLFMLFLLRWMSSATNSRKSVRCAPTNQREDHV